MAITITKQPENVTCNVGATVSLSLTATGVTAYQWQFSSDGGNTWSKLYWDGATTDTMTFTANETRMANLYRCMLTDADGNEVYTNVVRVYVPITVTKQPYNLAMKANATVYFRVEAEGDGLTYRWEYWNTQNWANNSMASATSSELTFTAKSYHDGYKYRCLITDAYGNQVRTNEVTLYIVNGALSADKGLVSMSTLSDIAGAIRAKTETTNAILPADMAAMIEGIETGGGILSGTFESTGSQSVNLGTILPESDNYIFCFVAQEGIKTSYQNVPITAGMIASVGGVKTGWCKLPPTESNGNDSYDGNAGSTLSVNGDTLSTTSHPLESFVSYGWWYAYV